MFFAKDINSTIKNDVIPTMNDIKNIVEVIPELVTHECSGEAYLSLTTTHDYKIIITYSTGSDMDIYVNDVKAPDVSINSYNVYMRWAKVNGKQGDIIKAVKKVNSMQIGIIYF